MVGIGEVAHYLRTLNMNKGKRYLKEVIICFIFLSIMFFRRPYCSMRGRVFHKVISLTPPDTFE